MSETLDSIASQRFQSGELGLEVIVVDGSESLGCFHETERHRPQLAQQGWQMRWMERPARGIYDALNAALTLARGRWLQVLPAGDLYADDRSLERLLAHGRRRLDAGRPPAAVFGQAWVEVPGRPLRWLTPDSRVRSMTAWLGRMVPCHQAFLFDGDWARAHPYPADSSIYGDRPVMRAALAASGSEAYLAEPVCRFRLGGVSSGLPGGRELLRRWRDPALGRSGRVNEAIKALVRPLAGGYPHLMRARAAWMGWRY
ncbi:glycosyltransferase [Cyanobium sp. ATX 6F1]|uniref:glycosyltransferase n=1 Tax=Cyanobium sp. ATX 6F1 TaxID=2823702 RepID=UPI0020CFACB1|nr:glycosyltransferase [Cyanobium sp. ATX 6F1]MCP9917452.1 glycosyltransferase [Cyanobium sp. ATX 6F1]